MQPMQWYGIVMGAVLLLSWFSNDEIIKKVSWLQLAGWVGANIVVEVLGFDHAPAIIPLLNAGIATLIGFLGYHNRSYLCFCLVLLYLAQETITVVAFSTHNQGMIGYYILQNGVFLLRMLTLGGWAVGQMVASRSHGGNPGLPHRLLGG